MEASVAVIDSNAPELSIEEVKKNIAPGATDKELFYFMNIAKTYGLNPFKREIYFVKFDGSPGQTMVGYEVYLKRAEKTGKLDGWDVRIEDMGQLSERAIITIYRKDRTKPFVWEVNRSEFDQHHALWKSKPQFMLRKVAISQGFRLAFPDELGGIPYTSEEINGGDILDVQDEPIDTTTVDVSDPVKEAETKATAIAEHIKDLLWAISNLKNELNVSAEQWSSLLTPFDVVTAKDLNDLQLVDLKHKLEAMRPTQAAQAA